MRGPIFMPHDVLLMVLGIVAIACGTAVITEIVKLWGKRGASSQALEAYEKRLARVEVALDDLTQSIGRVIEGQQFLTNVLSERELAALPPKR
jgi:hypothetical protein